MQPTKRISRNSLSIVALAAAIAGLATDAANAQVEIERRRPMPAKGQVAIENPFGSIVVRAWERAEVLVRGTVAGGAEEFSFEGEEKEVWISVSAPEAWYHAAGEDPAFHSTLEVFAPSGASLGVETVNASVDISGFTGEIEVDTVNGSVTIAGAPRQVTVETMTGAVVVNGKATPVHISTVSGAVVVQGATGEVAIETVSGKIDVAGSAVSALELQTTTGEVAYRGSVAARGSIAIETFSSPVKLTLPKATQATFELQTFGAAIQSDFCAGTPVTRERFEPFRLLRCSTGPEDFEIHVRTHSAEIVVTAE